MLISKHLVIHGAALSAAPRITLAQPPRRFAAANAKERLMSGLSCIGARRRAALRRKREVIRGAISKHSLMVFKVLDPTHLMTISPSRYSAFSESIGAGPK